MTATTTPARELIITALAQAAVPVTVTELAEQAGVGRSTVSKYLPALEKEGAAVRTPGGRQGRRRLPDTWTTAATSAEEPTADNAATPPGLAEDLDGAQDAVPAEQAGTDQRACTSGGSQHTETTTAPLADAPVAAEEATTTAAVSAALAAEPEQAPPAPAEPAPSTPRASTPRVRSRVGAVEPGECNPVSGSARLAPGELKVMVWALLDGEPGREFSASELSHLLAGRSIGAIQNNLATLTREGRAELTCDKPRRYRSATHPA